MNYAPGSTTCFSKAHCSYVNLAIPVLLLIKRRSCYVWRQPNLDQLRDCVYLLFCTDVQMSLDGFHPRKLQSSSDPMSCSSRWTFCAMGRYSHVTSQLLVQTCHFSKRLPLQVLGSALPEAERCFDGFRINRL